MSGAEAAVAEGAALGLPTVTGLYGEAAKAWPHIGQWPKLFLALAGGGSATLALSKAYQNAVESDERRAIRKKLRLSLVERLGGIMDEKGRMSPRAPMVVKLYGTRLGLSPIRPGASSMSVEPAGGRDVLTGI